MQEVTRQNRNPDINEVTSIIRQAIAEKHDLQVSAIVLVKPIVVFVALLTSSPSSVALPSLAFSFI